MILSFAPLNGIGWVQVWPVVTLMFGLGISHIAQTKRDDKAAKRDDARYDKEVEREELRNLREIELEETRHQRELEREKEADKRAFQRQQLEYERSLLIQLQTILPDYRMNKFRHLEAMSRATAAAAKGDAKSESERLTEASGHLQKAANQMHIIMGLDFALGDTTLRRHLTLMHDVQLTQDRSDDGYFAAVELIGQRLRTPVPVSD